MKHGRRHDSLKEKTYRERAAQDAPGYKRPYEPIDVGPESDIERPRRARRGRIDVREPEKPPAAPPPAATAVAAKLGRKTKKQLAHLGIDADAAARSDEP